ncbi:MAG: TIGR02099 family protein [Proteobacteria bacterium]|nr:TIGR02099 family protein [Pseudomonadota bacterium]
MWKRHFHRARLWLQALFAVVAIVLALCVGLAQIALPWIARHPQRIATFLGDRLHRTVTLDGVTGVWERDGPLLILSGVHIAGADAAAPGSTIPRAGLKINFFSAFHRNQAWNEFRLDGLNLRLAKDDQGHWQLSGIDTGNSANTDPKDSPLFALGALVLRDLRLTVQSGAQARPVILLADEVRLVNSGSDHRVLARVRCEGNQAPVDAIVDYDSVSRDGELYLGGSALDLAAVVHGHAWNGVQAERGTGRLQLWAWWQQDKLERARIEADLENLVLTTTVPIELDAKRTIVPRVGMDRIAFGARWQRGADGWSADVADLVFARLGKDLAPANLHLKKVRTTATPDPQWTLRLDAASLSAPASVAMLSDALPATIRRWLYLADPGGTIRHADVRFGNARDFDAAADFDALAWHAVGAVPGVTRFTGSLLGDADGFSLHLPARAAFGVDEPHVFRQPLEFSQFAGDIAAWHGDGGWCIGTDALDFEGDGYGGQLRGSVQLHDDGSQPALDVSAVVAHGQVPVAKLFWPINVIPPDAVKWLDRALVSGRIDVGRAVFRGDLADWPFVNFAGRFEARAEIRDARLVYLPDWPAAEHVHAVADFVNNGLRVEADAAQASGNGIDRASADIADLAEAVLELDVAGSGSGKNLLDFLKATPIGARYAGQLLGVGVGGNGKVQFHLHLPIKQSDQLDLAGSVALSKADLVDAQYGLRLQQANGTLRFSQHGFDTGDLPVTRNGAPADFRLAVGDFVTDKNHAVEASLRGKFPVADLLAYAPMLAPWADRINGAAEWAVGFSADADAEKDPGQRVTVDSDLDGVAIALPAPLTKAAAATLPLKLAVGLPIAGGSIDLRLGGLMRLRGRMASATLPFAARMDFGGDASAPLPASGFAIGGSAPLLDLSGWMDFVNASAGSGSDDWIADVDINAQDVRAWDRDLGAAQFTLKPSKTLLDLELEGTNVAGKLEVPLEDFHKRGVTAQFSHLYWPETPESETSAMAGENPAHVPPLHIRIGDFRLGESRFGQTTVESYPIAGGTHFEQVTAHSKNVEMRARGDWTGKPGSDVSAFSIDFSAQNLGRMLDTFGYAGVVDGGATVAHIQGQWAGSPSMFALSRLDGTLKVSVQEGRIPDADPGAGRIFGLFNLTAIPRRLALDFGDFFKSGFSFDSIDGTFTLKDGNAFTSGLRVKGPAADIVVNGRAGLKARDYDQTMEVTPHVGGTLMIGGALVGGPVGAAAGAVLQGVFKKALNDVTRVRYSVTGSWDKPVITEIAKETVKGEPASKKPLLESGKTPSPATGKPNPETTNGNP